MMFSEAYISRYNFKVKRQWLRLLVLIARDPNYSQLTSSIGVPTSLNICEGEKSAISTLALIYIFNSRKTVRLSSTGTCSFVICLLKYHFFYWNFMKIHCKEMAPQKGFVFLLPGFEV